VKILLQYIQYRIKAKGIHGIHSPFIFSLVNECFTAKVDKKFLFYRKNLFKRLKNDHSVIEIHDFGTGSKKMGKHRTISSIAQTSSSKGKYSLLLYKIAKHFQPKRTLEFGTSLGVGSVHLAAGYPHSKVTTVEGCPNTHEKAQEMIQTSQLENITLINSTFSDFITNHSHTKYDLVFIDGHHDGTALLHYLESLKKITHNDTLFILDDIRWSDSMVASWHQLTKDAYYHVSIDLFRMGILSPRSQQEKENFILCL
jgi:predicted O-methyltransferase YrrM